MKKYIISVLSIALLITGCSKSSDSNNSSKSLLRGSFTTSYEKNMKFKKTMEDNNSYLFASTYPAFLLNDDTDIKYAVDQKLSLKADYSYHYEYSITLKNSGNTDVVTIACDLYGTYTYEKLSTENTYYVSLNNPNQGKEIVYGANITNLTMFAYWRQLNEPSFILDIEEVKDDPTFTYDKYIKGRKVKVTKGVDGNPNTIDDVMYYRFILDDIMPYSIIQSTR